MAHSDRASETYEETPTGPVVHDRRRIDPVTGQVREAEGSAPRPAGEATATGDARLPGSGESVSAARVAELEATVAERTADLQRVQAEYANYRRRIDRDRAAMADTAVASVLSELLGVLDDIELARQHGDLTGPFRTVAERLEAALAKLGLVRYGEPGEEFDPTVHEALTHGHSDQVDRPTAVAVLQPGYRFATANLERILRPARVAVAEPAPAAQPLAEPAGQATAQSADQAPAGQTTAQSADQAPAGQAPEQSADPASGS